MKTWIKCAAGLLALACWTLELWAQVAAPAAPAAAAPAAAAAGVQPGGLWSFLGLSQPQLAVCKEKFCATQLGKMMNNGISSMGAMTGGLIGPCCPVATKADLAKPADSAEGAAARIKADEAAAKARRAAVRYLGTVDCHYWPEAEAGMINALRTDKNECVRMEAAWQMGMGCCCTKKTVEALAITVSGSDRDGNPAERSDRVKEAARFSMERCVACFNAKCAVGDQLPPPKEQAPKESTTETKKDTRPYYEKISTQPAEEIYDRARKLLERGTTPDGTLLPGSGPTTDAEDHSVISVIRTAFGKGTNNTSNNNLKPVATTSMAMSKPNGTVLFPNVGMAKQNIPTEHVFVQQPVKTEVVKQEPVKQGPAKMETVKQEPVKQQPRVVEAARKPATPAPAAEPDTFRMPEGGVVSVARPVDRPAQPMPEPATAYRTITYHKPAQGEAASTGLPPGVFLPNLLESLQRGSQPEREWAAKNLNAVDSRAHPEVIQALATSSRGDPAPSVRATCVRSLADMDADSPEVINALNTLRGDISPEVRDEVQKALIKLSK